MIARDFCRCFGTAGLLKVVFGAVLGCAASAALFFSEPASQPATYLDTAGWTIAEFVDHLKRNSLQFRVVPVAQDGPLCHGVFLTENDDWDWESLQGRLATVEFIHEWHGTVRVLLRDPLTFDVDDPAAQQGNYNCWIGCFLLVGDAGLLRRIQGAFAQ